MVSVALTDQESPPSYLGELRGKKKKNANLGRIPARDKYCAVVVLQLRIPSFFFPGYKHFLDVTQKESGCFCVHFPSP